jgi:dihydroorotase
LVTAEVTPHHLLLTEEALEGYNTHYKMMPPLRTEKDRRALIEGLKDGTLDMIATGHAPHTDFEKNLDFQNAPFGVIGLETALPALFEGLVSTGELEWSRLTEVLSLSPRALLKLEPLTLDVGQPFEALLFNPQGKTWIDRTTLCSKSFNSPWLHQTLAGGVEHVFC